MKHLLIGLIKAIISIVGVSLLALCVGAIAVLIFIFFETDVWYIRIGTGAIVALIGFVIYKYFIKESH